MENTYAAYLWEYFREAESVLKEAEETLANVEFDGFVCTGLSGLLVGPTLALRMNKHLAVVRKPDDRSNHSPRRVEMNFPQKCKWLFLDDLICSGRTRAYIYHEMCVAGRTKGFGEYLWLDKVYREWNAEHFRQMSDYQSQMNW